MKYLFQTKFTLSLFLAVFISCEENSSLDEPLKVFEPHTESPVQDEVWKRGIHIISKNINIKNVTVTIEPGAIIKLNRGVSINVGSNASNYESTIIAIGTKEDPIIFTSVDSIPKPGDWECISISEDASPNSVFRHCIFEYGGDIRTGYLMRVDENSISMDYCLIRHSAENAIILSNGGYFNSFTNNSISDSPGYPIMSSPNSIHTIGQNNTISTSKGILVFSGEYNQVDTTWFKQTCPYIIKGLRMKSSDEGCILRIEAGTTIQIEKDVRIQGGAIIANGTSDAKITFTSAESEPQAGDWANIKFGGSSLLNYCVFEYGGSVLSEAMIIVESYSEFKNCTFRHAKGSAVSS